MDPRVKPEGDGRCVEETWELAVMSTSAKKLYDLLNASLRVDGDPLLYEAVDFILDNECERSEVSSAAELVTLAREIDANIEQAQIDDSLVAHMRSQFSKFAPLVNFQYLNTKMSVLKKDRGLLSSDNLQKLISLHLALDGKVNLADEIKDNELLLELLDELLTEIDNAGFPKDFSLAIYSRLLHIRSAILNFRYCGHEAVETQLNILVGEIVLNSSKIKNNEKSGGWLKTLAETVQKLVSSINSAKSVSGDALEAIENVSEIMSKLPDLG